MAEPTPGELRLLELAARNQLAHEATGPHTVSRRRIALLLDPETFRETGAFTVPPTPNPALGGRRIPGDGVVAGSGLIGGRPVFVFAQEPTIFGGSLGEAHAKKIAATVRSAISANAPILGLYDTQGIRLEEGVAALAGSTALAFELARAAGVIPSLAAVFQSSAPGDALLPALADFTFAPSSQPLTAANEAELLLTLRNLLAFLPSSHREAPPRLTASPLPSHADTLPPAHSDEPVEMLTAITRIADPNSLLELQPHVAANLITAFARLGGRPVAVVANQPTALEGVLDRNACAKAERFIRFANAFRIPLLVFVDTPGPTPETKPEALAALLQAFAQSPIRLTLTVGQSSGQAASIMNPRPLTAGLNLLHLAWPSAQIAAASPEAAVDRLHHHEFEAAARTAHAIWPQGKPFTHDDRTRILTNLRRERLDDYRARHANPWLAAEHGALDAVIPPSETRRRLLHALNVLLP